MSTAITCLAQMTTAGENNCLAHRRAANSASCVPSGHRYLNDKQEDELIAWVFVTWRLGFPATEEHIKRQALALMQLAGRQPRGTMEHWWTHFRHKHAGVAKMIHAQFQSPRRYQLSQDALNAFYDLVAHVVHEYKLTPERIFNLDETGTEKLGGRAKVMVPAHAEEARVCGLPLDDHMTVLTCVRCDGKVLPPLYIFKGNFKTVPRAWRLAGAPEGSRVTYTGVHRRVFPHEHSVLRACAVFQQRHSSRRQHSVPGCGSLLRPPTARLTSLCFCWWTTTAHVLTR